MPPRCLLKQGFIKTLLRGRPWDWPGAGGKRCDWLAEGLSRGKKHPRRRYPAAFGSMLDGVDVLFGACVLMELGAFDALGGDKKHPQHFLENLPPPAPTK